MYSQNELLEKYSIYAGLDELQQEFLKEEIQKNSQRSTAVLRNVAKKRALMQRMKWFVEDILIAVGLLSVLAALIIILLIFMY